MTSVIPVAELVSYLQVPSVDAYTGNLVMEGAEAAFAEAAGVKLTPTASMYSTFATGDVFVYLPDRPVTTVASVTVGGTAVTDYVRSGQALYRSAGFGNCSTNPPVLMVVSYTAGFATVPADVKAAVLDIAAVAFNNPDQTTREQVDDYATAHATGGFQLTASARAVVERYRIPAAV